MPCAPPPRSVTRPLRAILTLAKWIPVVFITSVVVWSYYAYVVQLCLLTVASFGAQCAMLTLYHAFLAMFVWAYWRTVFTAPGTVPKRFHLTSEEMDTIESADNPKTTLDQLMIAKDLPCTMRSLQQEVRYCTECSSIKPDRAHHCGVCGQCVLKMDHHCPWVNNCVAFNNYKFFILFLGYGLLYCIFIALSSLKYFLQFWTMATTGTGDSGKFHILFLFFVSAMFSISLASLFFYHLYLISRNTTTLEAFRPPIFNRRGPDKKAFYLGTYNNFQEVFGDNKMTWFLPVFSSFGDGITFPQRCLSDEEAGLLGTSPQNTEMYPSEEHVPMMLTEESETTMRWGDQQRGQKPGQSTSSSGSEADMRNGSVRINGQMDLSRPQTATTQDLVAVNM